MPTININTTGNALGQFLVKYSAKIHQALKQKFEFEKFLPKVSCDYAYQGQDVTHSRVLQPYQKAFTPNNDATFDGVLNVLGIGKIDLSYSWLEMEKFFDKWRNNWFEAGKDESDWGYPAYMINNVVFGQFEEDLNLTSYNGVHVAPAVGVAGTYDETFNGFKTSIAAFVGAGDLTPLVTGVIGATTAEAQFKDYCQQMPQLYRERKGTIFCSKDIARLYAEDYQAKHPTYIRNINNPDEMYMKVDTYNKRVVGFNCMQGSDRMITVFDGLDSMIIGTRKGYSLYPELRVDVGKREIDFYGEMYRFFGYETLRHMFVNDQA